MVRATGASLVISLAFCQALFAAEWQEADIRRVADTKGLVAFWDFTLNRDGRWTSHRDPQASDREYPLALRRIGDPKSYDPNTWPYPDEPSKLTYDTTGPFGSAVRMNQGYVFAAVPREAFDRTPLDIHGQAPLTLIAWVKLTSRRHFIAGIWDEGGWRKYSGSRQYALFTGLAVGPRSSQGHVSSTGAATCPQSNAAGAQYARLLAADGRDIPDGVWVALAMTRDPGRGEVKMFLNGVATPRRHVDEIAADVFGDAAPDSVNPLRFTGPLYSPWSFLLKFNGYDRSSGVHEHMLHVETEFGRVTYLRAVADSTKATGAFRVTVDVQRDERSMVAEPILFDAEHGKSVAIDALKSARAGDRIIATLEVKEARAWRGVGKPVRRVIGQGAPFTIGRALGLGAEKIDFGGTFYVDGVAVFNRVLGEEELAALSFAKKRSVDPKDPVDDRSRKRLPPRE